MRSMTMMMSTMASKSSTKKKVAIVGSGPAGFYTAHKLLQKATGEMEVEIDLLEALPIPFGLVRYGVAPDHPEVKNVQHKFETVASDPRVSFFGNVRLDEDVSIDDLRKIYDVIVFAYGASKDRRLNIEGERELNGIYGAREMVGWYNGYPSYLKVDLEHTDTAVIIGMGNVALDLARVLLTPVDILAKTDITENALEVLRKSRIKRVILMGRRGPVQVSFTAKELRELFNIPGVKCQIDLDYLKSEIVKHLPHLKHEKSKTRLMNLMLTLSEKQKAPDESLKVCEFMFQSSPLSFLPSLADPKHVGGVKYCLNELTGPSLSNPKAVPLLSKTSTIETGLVLESIGYEVVAAKGLPFNKHTSSIPNDHGRIKFPVDHHHPHEMPGMFYVSGWLKTGPRGTIASTMMESFDTAATIIRDLSENRSDQRPRQEKDGREGLLRLMGEKRINYVTFDDWKKIEAEEQKRGDLKGKPREKITDINEILRIMNKAGGS
jgi:adrenodoxin-NADP+ reductase